MNIQSINAANKILEQSQNTSGVSSPSSTPFKNFF